VLPISLLLDVALGLWESASVATSEVRDGHSGFLEILGVFPRSARCSSFLLFLFMGSFDINVFGDLLRMGVSGRS